MNRYRFTWRLSGSGKRGAGEWREYDLAVLTAWVTSLNDPQRNPHGVVYGYETDPLNSVAERESL